LSGDGPAARAVVWVRAALALRRSVGRWLRVAAGPRCAYLLRLESIVVVESSTPPVPVPLFSVGCWWGSPRTDVCAIPNSLQYFLR